MALVTIRKDWEMIPKKLTGYDGFAPNEKGENRTSDSAHDCGP